MKKNFDSQVFLNGCLILMVIIILSGFLYFIDNTYKNKDPFVNKHKQLLTSYIDIIKSAYTQSQIDNSPFEWNIDWINENIKLEDYYIKCEKIIYEDNEIKLNNCQIKSDTKKYCYDKKAYICKR